MNTQKAEQVISTSDYLEVNEIFYSIQGEGPFSGHPAVFVRLAGCNLKCPQCDTIYLEREKMRQSEVFDKITSLSDDKKKTSLVVITGGEPFRQATGLQPLLMILKGAGYAIQIETNGSIYPANFPWPLAVIVCSPKGQIHKDMDSRIDAFKYVLSSDRVDPNDGLPLDVLGNDDRPSRPQHGQPVYLQPLDVKNPDLNKRNQTYVVDSCMEFGYRLCLQLHKIIGVE